MNPRVCILQTDGTNCDRETAYAFMRAGGNPRLVHINQLRARSVRLADFQILAIPGGFSYGDDVASGKILALELTTFLSDELRAFVEAGKLVIGICNGFQVLVRTGLLPFRELGKMSATLTHNVSGRFQCEWVRMVVEQGSPCVFTRGMESEISLQIAHGEGRFFASPETLVQIEERKLVALRYAPHNPNGSENAIAGVCDPSGRIFGLMPHPERFVDPLQHPNWRSRWMEPPHGLKIFQNAVAAARNL
ncbi:phosphoribosylformylglycinamidine synthase I [Candidatus Uhrbacteria bacterium]|nr:phosphoribosylformylglycinamidine synthase I [Candidatus Uhrbacteria bacterium]